MGKKRSNAGLLVVTVLVALPFVPLFLWAFAGEWRFPDLLPTEWSLRGVASVMEPGGRVLGATLNSLLIGMAVAVASVAAGTPAGMALGGYEWRFKGAVIFFVLLPILVPPLASTMGVHLTFIRLGLADTAFGVFLVHLVAVAGLFAFLISWGQYVLTILIGGGNVVTLPMLLFSAASGNDPVITSSLAIVFALPAVLALVVALHFLRSSERDGGNGFVGLGRVS
ncbi:MAG: hypothetical protein M3533_10045 [Actinomycetota bacterium]|nr:hypothetical protein [Actinomycetota bacterium]